MDRTVKVELMGREYTLAYTVLADLSMTEHMGGIRNVKNFLNAPKPHQRLENLCWLLNCLMEAGEAYEASLAEFEGRARESEKVPTARQLVGMLGKGDIAELLQKMLEAVKKGSQRTVAAKPSKKKTDGGPLS